MAYAQKKFHPFTPPKLPGSTVIATIDKITEDGEIYVDYENNLNGPFSVSVLAGALLEKKREDLIGAQVLIIWSNRNTAISNQDQPILIDVLIDRLPGKSATSESTVVHLDGDILVLEGKREIQFCCGKSSVVLQADGKIVIKGGDIVSRASRTHKIKGGSVEIN